jgi:hypothetical protein
LSNDTAAVNANNRFDVRLVEPMPPCTSRPTVSGPSSVQLQAKVSANRAAVESGVAPASSSVHRMKLPKVQMNPSSHSSRYPLMRPVARSTRYCMRPNIALSVAPVMNAIASSAT